MSEVEQLRKRLEDLKQERDTIISPLGFLLVGRQNLNNRKIIGSFSGNVILGLIIGSARLLALAIDRIWDKQGLQLHQLIKDLSDKPEGSLPLPALSAFRLSESTQVISNESLDISALNAEALRYFEGDLRKRIRIYRSEQLAHSQRGNSRDRKNLGNGVSDLCVTLEDIEVAGRFTLKIIDQAFFVATREDLNSHQFLKIEISNVTRFWRALPSFAEVEFMDIVP